MGGPAYEPHPLNDATRYKLVLLTSTVLVLAIVLVVPWPDLLGGVSDRPGEQPGSDAGLAAPGAPGGLGGTEPAAGGPVDGTGGRHAGVDGGPTSDDPNRGDDPNRVGHPNRVGDPNPGDEDDPGNEDDFIDHGTLAGSVIDAETAARLFPNLRLAAGHRHRFDPVALVSLIPDKEVVYDWPEHPNGRIVARTNNLGLREDQPTATGKYGPRVLVLGDSHTEGFVDNGESFANVLEERLGVLPDGRRVEVLNAGVGGTAPHAFAAMLRKHLPLRPDLVLAVLFTGNDVFGDLAISDFFTKRGRIKVPVGYQERLRAARDSLDDPPDFWGPAILGNGPNQAYRFKHRPEEVDLAMDAVLASFDDMAAQCGARSIPFAAVILPTKDDVEPHDDRERMDAALALMEMTREEASLNARLAARFAEAMRARGIPCVDPTERMRARDEILYWRKDYHLNVVGHALLADIIRADLGTLLPGN